MVKMLYIAKRHPSLTPAGFVARWRQHGALAMSLQLWRRMTGYVQASVISPAPLAGASDGYDAIGVLWNSDAPMTEADAADSATMAKDEEETFAHYISPGLQIFDEKVLKHDGPGRVTAYLCFSNAEAARKAAEAAVARPEADRVTLNTPLPGVNRNLPYEAVVEVAAKDATELSRALGPSGAKAVGVDLALIAREAILWG